MTVSPFKELKIEAYFKLLVHKNKINITIHPTCYCCVDSLLFVEGIVLKIVNSPYIRIKLYLKKDERWIRREITLETDLINICSVDVSCDIIPPGSEKLVKVGCVNLEIRVQFGGQTEHSPTLFLGLNPGSVSSESI